MRACEPEAGMNAGKFMLRDTRLRQRIATRPHHLRNGRLAESDVTWTRFSLA
jgi:hypothetical protein